MSLGPTHSVLDNLLIFLFKIWIPIVKIVLIIFILLFILYVLFLIAVITITTIVAIYSFLDNRWFQQRRLRSPTPPVIGRGVY